MTANIEAAYAEYEIMENPSQVEGYLEHLAARAQENEFDEMVAEIIAETKGY